MTMALSKTQVTRSLLTSGEREELACREAIIERGLATFIEVGNELVVIRDKRLYCESYPTFEEYCRERWGFQRHRANRLIAAAGLIDNLVPVGTKLEENSTNNHLPLPSSERQARPLTRLEPEQQREAWREAIETAPNGKVTAAHVEKVVARIKPHISRNTGENEWYTPQEYVEAACKVMGSIDLDPASADEANLIVRATKYYTPETDGLSKEWRGKVWMNPPYAQPLVTQFIAKLIEHVQSGDVPEAIVLINNATETSWFARLIEVASAVCFPRGRVKFWHPDGRIAAPLQGQAIIYIGTNTDAFIKEFEGFGWVAIIALPAN